MAKKKPAPEKVTTEDVEEDVDVVKEESIKEKKSERKKRAKKDDRLSVLQEAVLETIRERPQRPRAIQTIIRGVGGVDVPRNEIIRSLNELREKGLVDKVTTKAWQAK